MRIVAIAAEVSRRWQWGSVRVAVGERGAELVPEVGASRCCACGCGLRSVASGGMALRFALLFAVSVMVCQLLLSQMQVHGK